MSLSIEFYDASGEEQTSRAPLSSASEWKAIADWASNLSPTFGHIKTLTQDGMVQGTNILVEQLEQALAEHKPPQPLLDVLELLIENIGDGDVDEIAAVTNE